jgi:3-oxoacyl-[acyl-carrier-protein] synthase III
MCVPRKVVTNDDLAHILDTSDDWIRSRTGIVRRRIAEANESSAQMSIEAARAALQVADANPRDIGLIIVGTSTPDYIFPSTACQVQNALGAIHAGAFDLNAACSGFVYALATAHQAIVSGEHDLVLVIGVDTLSRRLNWQDRNTCVLFGDGAGAVLLRASQGPAGVLATVLGADGSGGDILMIPAGGCVAPLTAEVLEQNLHTVHMNGQEVYRFATRILASATEQVTKKAGLEMEQVDVIVPHQANLRIVETASKRLKVPMERFVTNLEEYGNTSAASIPIALCEAIEQGRITPGSNVVMVGFGAGLTWGAVAVKWSVPPGEAVSPRYRNWWRSLLYRWAALRGGWLRMARNVTIWLIRRATRRDRYPRNLD